MCGTSVIPSLVLSSLNRGLGRGFVKMSERSSARSRYVWLFDEIDYSSPTWWCCRCRTGLGLACLRCCLSRSIGALTRWPLWRFHWPQQTQLLSLIERCKVAFGYSMTPVRYLQEKPNPLSNDECPGPRHNLRQWIQWWPYCIFRQIGFQAEWFL